MSLVQVNVADAPLFVPPVSLISSCTCARAACRTQTPSFFIHCLVCLLSPIQEPVDQPWFKDIVVYDPKDINAPSIAELQNSVTNVRIADGVTQGNGRTLFTSISIRGERKSTFKLRNVLALYTPVHPYDKSMNSSIQSERGPDGRVDYFIGGNALNEDSRMTMRVRLDPKYHAEEIKALQQHQYNLACDISSRSTHFFPGSPPYTVQQILDMFQGLLGAVNPEDSSVILNVRINGWQDALDKAYLLGYNPGSYRKGGGGAPTGSFVRVDPDTIVQKPVLLGASRPPCKSSFKHPPISMLDKKGDSVIIVPQTVDSKRWMDAGAEVVRHPVTGVAQFQRLTPYHITPQSITTLQIDMSSIHVGVGKRGFELFHKLQLVKAAIVYLAPLYKPVPAEADPDDEELEAMKAAALEMMQTLQTAVRAPRIEASSVVVPTASLSNRITEEQRTTLFLKDAASADQKRGLNALQPTVTEEEDHPTVANAIAAAIATVAEARSVAGVKRRAAADLDLDSLVDEDLLVTAVPPSHSSSSSKGAAAHRRKAVLRPQASDNEQDSEDEAVSLPPTPPRASKKGSSARPPAPKFHQYSTPKYDPEEEAESWGGEPVTPSAKSSSRR